MYNVSNIGGSLINIIITKDGGIKMLHHDVADLESFGKVNIKRASHVEYDNEKQKWFVQSAKTLKILHYAESREQALAWERDYYSPQGEGWNELNEDNK